MSLNDKKLFSHPLITIDEERNQLPHTFATATFAGVYDRFFMVTPAHALESKNGKPVYLSIDTEPFSLAGKAVYKQSEADIAVTELLNTEIDRVFKSTIFVTKDLLLPEDKKHLTLLEGYPANRNKMKSRRKKIQKSIHLIMLDEPHEEYFPDENYYQPCHFAYKYNEKKLFDENSKRVSPRQLAGMSGGMFKKILEDDGIVIPEGIFLAQDKGKHALIGLNYNFILDWIEANLSRFEKALNQ